MAAVVARGGSQLSTSLPAQEKGSRNKRKFRADPPLADLNKLVPPQAKCLNYEFPAEKLLNKPNLGNHVNVCELCNTLIGHTMDELGVEEFQEADWNHLTESQLEELVLSNLDIIFKTAIKKIASHGYTEEVAAKAILRLGLFYGCKDTISNIVDNTLSLLSNGADVDSTRDHIFEDLQQLKKYVLAEMVCVLREVRPFFSTGDAMWCLLISDMNVSHACAMDDNPFGNLGSNDTTGSSSVRQLKPDSNPNAPSSSNTVEFNAQKTDKPNSLLPHPQSAPQIETSAVTGIPNLPSGRFSASRNKHGKKSNPNIGQKNQLSSYDHVEEESSSSTLSQLNLLEEKPVGGKRGHGITSKRESILQKDSIHFEKSYRPYGTKGGSRTGKVNGLSSLILDKKCKSISDSTGIKLKSASVKLSKAVGMDVTQTDGLPSISFNAVTSEGPTHSPKTVENPSPLPIANVELSLSLPSKTGGIANSNPNCRTEIANYCNYLGIPWDKMDGQWVPQDKKDEMLLKLVPCVRELQAQLQEWNEWAQQKVMQAARRLSKDKVELQSLRQEKEEANSLTKEKTLGDSTLKKLLEREKELAKARDDFDRISAETRAREAENTKLRLQMEATKLSAAQSAAKFQEVSKRVMNALKKFQSFENQKALLQEELVTEKHELSQLQQQMEWAKEYQDELEARWKREEKVKDEALTQANSERREREQHEASAKLEEDTIRLKAGSDSQRYRDEIQSLENQIAQLRLKTDSSKIAALRWSVDGSYASRLADEKSSLVLKDSNTHNVSEIMDLLDPGFGDLRRDRECVMCLSDEMSVVFLPCAHQVVCKSCNELHEKEGMNDCPSCRTPIQRRICVRLRHS